MGPIPVESMFVYAIFSVNTICGVPILKKKTGGLGYDRDWGTCRMGKLEGGTPNQGAAGAAPLSELARAAKPDRIRLVYGVPMEEDTGVGGKDSREKERWRRKRL
ncbi:hypothetical protein OPQ81_002869 [Rhizoctonia solani]|nr:hypothetical protein OPQ81_002869 [Rhizoctonia solani]